VADAESAADAESGAARRPHHWAPDDWPAPIRALCAISRGLAVAEGVGIALCLAAITLLSVWECADRNLSFHHLPSLHVPGWIDNAIRHSVFMIGFLGGAYATYTARHIRIDAVTRVLPPRRRMAVRLLSTLGALFIVTLLIRASWLFHDDTVKELGDAAQVGDLFPSWRGSWIPVIGYLGVAFHFLVQFALDVAWLVSGKQPPPEWVAEASH